MNDQDVIDGMKAFADWHKTYMKESNVATNWKIPIGCISEEKKVWLTVEEAKRLLNLVSFLKTTLPIDAIFERCAIDALKERIEQTEDMK